MKKHIFAFLLISSFLVYAAERVELGNGESYLIEDKNVTLVKSDSKNDAAIFCVNGKKGLVGEDKSKNVNGVYIELIRLSRTSAIIDVSYDCKKCSCVECSNEACLEKQEELIFAAEPEDIEENEPIIMKSITGNTVDAGETVVQPSSIDAKEIVIAGLIILVLLLGIIVIWRRT